MTYAGFLLVFLCVPIAVLLFVQRRWLTRSHLIAIAALMAIALIYTTPWDNYLVANRVWWYDTELVTGIVIGWVPIEEYTFFLLQPLLAGLWLLMIGKKFAPELPFNEKPTVRWAVTLGISLLWVLMLALLISGVGWATYLSLMLVWALPPLMLQSMAGADILWHQRKQVLIAIISSTLYLSAADALAISGGTWTIAPDKSLNFFLGGVLPLEEFIFFLLTNTLIVVGVTLLLSTEMRERIALFFHTKLSAVRSL